MKYLLTFLSSVGATIFQGYVLTVLWSWFVVPTFGLNPLNIPTALGVMLLSVYLTHSLNFHNAEVEDFNLKLQVVNWLKPLFALLFGYIYTMFM